MKTFSHALAGSTPVGAMRLLIGLVFLASAARGVAQHYVSDEDRTRFREQPYRKAEPGLLPPSAYIAMAKQAIRSHSKKITFDAYSDGVVTRRIYRNAPAEDRDIICVQFVYLPLISGGGILNGGDILMKSDPPVPVLQALIRRDRSKIYLNMIGYRAE